LLLDRSYRRFHVGDLDPLRVASFLILEKEFPRSVRFSVRMAHEAIAAVRAEINPTAVDSAERILGRLATQLDYAEVSEILAQDSPRISKPFRPPQPTRPWRFRRRIFYIEY